MPTTREIFSTKKKAGASSFKRLCENLDLEMATRPSKLPESEDSWTAEMIALDAQSASAVYKETIEAHGWSVQEFNHVWYRMPNMGERNGQ
jgi:hypothetical protein